MEITSVSRVLKERLKLEKKVLFCSYANWESILYQKRVIHAPSLGKTGDS